MHSESGARSNIIKFNVHMGLIALLASVQCFIGFPCVDVFLSQLPSVRKPALQTTIGFHRRGSVDLW